MKKLFTLAILVVAVSFTSCSKHTETIKNLQQAITGEANASAKYTAFAERAHADSLPNIASMFRAISRSEDVHRDNHMAELKKLGVQFTPVVAPVIVDSTLANLYVAKSGEEYEVQSMYPEFIAVAQKEKAKGAAKSFDVAMQIETKHAQFYITAIDTFQITDSDETLFAEWIVCPKCGDTYIKGTEPQSCDICGVSSENFLAFE